MTARVVMIVGTTSSAGKSMLVTALCRIFARRGLRVAPFKAQNLSNNAAVCPDGSEIGRSTAVQAAAAGVAPAVDMNPLLLKPEADARSQVVLLGKPWRGMPAGAGNDRQAFVWSTVTGALDRLRERNDLVVIEGAGSPVELNLKGRDIVNMAIARYAGAPTLLVGDIDRGGIFAQLLGTLWLMEPAERALVKGLVVNKFRGDLGLFADGVQILAERGQVPVLGVLPFLADLDLPAEDSLALDERRPSRPGANELDIAVVQLPHIANFDDFDPLGAERGVHVRYVSSPGELGRPDAVILPGSKATIADLNWLSARNLADAIRKLAAAGTAVVGICGGYQMLGRIVRDPEKIESAQLETQGLALLPLETVFAGQKVTVQTQARLRGGPGWLAPLAGQIVSGYEIHQGRTTGGQHWLEVHQRAGESVREPEGAMGPAGRIWGSYLHGLFANTALRRAWLNSLGWRAELDDSLGGFQPDYDRLADFVEGALDIDRLETIISGT